MPTFSREDKPHIDITHEDEWEVDFTIHTPILSFSARQFEPNYPNRQLAGRRDIMLNGLDPEKFAGPEGARELASHLRYITGVVEGIGVLGPRAFLENNRGMVRR